MFDRAVHGGSGFGFVLCIHSHVYFRHLTDAIDEHTDW
jgi:hypothetical protein